MEVLTVLVTENADGKIPETYDLQKPIRIGIVYY